jgi:hypothetical protein
LFWLEKTSLLGAPLVCYWSYNILKRGLEFKLALLLIEVIQIVGGVYSGSTQDTVQVPIDSKLMPLNFKSAKVNRPPLITPSASTVAIFYS